MNLASQCYFARAIRLALASWREDTELQLETDLDIDSNISYNRNSDLSLSFSCQSLKVFSLENGLTSISGKSPFILDNSFPGNSIYFFAAFL